jgi:hypothetical protein
MLSGQALGWTDKGGSIVQSLFITRRSILYSLIHGASGSLNDKNYFFARAVDELISVGPLTSNPDASIAAGSFDASSHQTQRCQRVGICPYRARASYFTALSRNYMVVPRKITGAPRNPSQ